jgi:hypothetical protein
MTVGQLSGTQVVPCCEKTPRHESMYKDCNSSLPGEMRIQVFTQVTPCEKSTFFPVHTMNICRGKKRYSSTHFYLESRAGWVVKSTPQVSLLLEKETRYPQIITWVGPKTELDVVGKKISRSPRWESNPGRSIPTVCGLKVSGSGNGQLARTCEDRTTFSNFIKWQNCLEYLWKYSVSEEVLCSTELLCWLVSQSVSYEIQSCQNRTIMKIDINEDTV